MTTLAPSASSSGKPAKNDSTAVEGMMCSVLALKMASKRRPGPASTTSNSSGAGVLGSAASSSQAAIPGRFSGRSEVCQLTCGKAAAKNIACWPVPLPISSTSRRSAKCSFRTSRMGSRFRSQDGAFGFSTAISAGSMRPVCQHAEIEGNLAELLGRPQAVAGIAPQPAPELGGQPERGQGGEQTAGDGFFQRQQGQRRDDEGQREQHLADREPGGQRLGLGQQVFPHVVHGR